MPLENEGRLDISCLVGNFAATIVTRCGIVYQGTILDWDCGGFPQVRTDNCPSDSGDSNKEASPIPRTGGDRCRSFIRIQLACIPGNICCPLDPNGAEQASRVTGIFGTDIGTPINIPLYALLTPVLINWDDVSSIGSIGTTVCLTPDINT